MTGASQLITRLAAAVLATAAVGVGGLATAPAATAAACGSSAGVSVVVDFGALGGGVETGCIAGGAGQSASSLFQSAGFDLSYVQNQPGFVCRVNQRPSPNEEACVNTPPDNAYWALWWSDGESGSWSYSNYGVGRSRSPTVGRRLRLAERSRPPRTSPGPHASSPPPTPTPTATPTSGGGGGGGGGGNGGGNGGGSGGQASATPTVKPSSKPPRASTSAGTPTATVPGSLTPGAASTQASESVESPTASPTLAPSESALPTASGSTSAVATPSDSVSTTPLDPDASAADGAASLPQWAVPIVLVLLATAGGATYLLRRRNRTSP